MRTIEVGETRLGNLAVLVEPDSEEKVFTGLFDAEQAKRKVEFRSPWIRLTGSVIAETPPERLWSGEALDEMLPQVGRNGQTAMVQLAIAKNVVVAFPSAKHHQPSLNLDGWRLITGPTEASLQEVMRPDRR